MIKISIIIPVYNAQKYLDKCLNSVINQTLKEIEIICINDGSIDNSDLILDKYAQKDSRIKVINKKNEGQAVARNIGIEVAQGEFLGFVDSDDWIDLNYFEKMYIAAKKYNCDIACAGFKRQKKHKFKISKNFECELVCTNINDKVKLDKLPAHNYIWNKIYKKSVWLKKDIKFEPGRYYEDMALVIRILNNFGPMVTVPKVYYNYRLNPTSTVSQKSPKHIDDYHWALNELISYAKENNIYIELKNILHKKEYYRFLNITLLKVYHYYYKSEYKLFGFIPFVTKQIS